jgi:hypothetical protein
MIKSLIHRIPVLALAALAVLLASCVKEEFVECLELRLLVTTDQDTGRWAERTAARALNEDDWYNSINSVSVYAFDENEKFVTRWIGGAYTPGEDYEVPLKELNLPEGVYTFVAWTNSDEGELSDYNSNLEELVAADTPADTPDETRAPGDGFYLKDLRMLLSGISPDGEPLEEDLTHRHHGIQKTYVSNNSILSPGPYAIELFPSLHKVNFKITTTYAQGEEPEPGTNPAVTLTVLDNNSIHDFHNGEYDVDRYEDDSQTYRHIRTMNESLVEVEGGAVVELDTSLYLMQLDDDTTTRLEIHTADYPDTPIYVEQDLVQLIRNAYMFGEGGDGRSRSVDFDHRLEFDITIDLTDVFNPDPMNTSKIRVAFIIDGWRYVPQSIII